MILIFKIATKVSYFFKIASIYAKRNFDIYKKWICEDKYLRGKVV